MSIEDGIPPPAPAPPPDRIVSDGEGPVKTVMEAAQEVSRKWRALRNILVRDSVCWWFGCTHAAEYPYWKDGMLPCVRCGAPDISYDDRVGYTRHQRLKDALGYWLWRRWVPGKCVDCGRRYGHHDDCNPF